MGRHDASGDIIAFMGGNFLPILIQRKAEMVYSVENFSYRNSAIEKFILIQYVSANESRGDAGIFQFFDGCF
jgi:hypothetical protein